MIRIRRTALSYYPEHKGSSDGDLLAVIFTQVYRHDARLMVERFYELYPDEDYDSFRHERLLYLEIVGASQEKIRSTNRIGFKKSNDDFGIVN